jgi:ribonuclease-3
MNETYENLPAILAIFRDINPTELDKAFVHSSFKGLKGGRGEDNTRLAFLGDAVINLVEADRLFHTKGELPKGLMTDDRQKLVSNDALSKLYDNKLKLDGFLRTENDYPVQPGDRATIVEALFGLLFNEKSIEPCQDLWNSLLKKNCPSDSH